MNRATATSSLKGRVAIITGSSRGIGFETAKALGQAGAKVGICGRDSVALKHAASELTKLGVVNTSLSLDLTGKRAAKRMVQHVIDSWGTLDILVNNVGGIPTTGSFSSLNDKDWQAVFDLNLMTMVRFSRETIPYLKASKHGRIVNLSSVVSRQPGRMNPHYSVMKAGVLNLTKHLSNLLAPDGILVNSISPGIISTEGWQTYLAEKSEQENRTLAEVTASENARASQSTPLGRLGTPQDVAALVLFLCSQKASFITGSDFAVDGGKMTSI